jgi:hypothetical protein
VTIPVTVSTPENDLPRGESFDFHHEEGVATSEEQREGQQREGGE